MASCKKKVDDVGGSSDVISEESSSGESDSEGSNSGESSSEESSSEGSSSAGGSTSSKPTGGNTGSSSNGGGTVAGTKTFKVEDFGAKGDGVSDDGPAIGAAVIAASKDRSENKIVQFKANSTYRVTSVAKENQTYKHVIQVVNGKNITIQGDNTKLLMKAPCRVARFSESQNVTMQGFIIDYSPKPFALGVATSVNSSQKYIDFKCSEDLGFTGTVTAPYFAFRNRKEERRHFFIDKMQKLGADTYRFYFTDAAVVSLAKSGEEFILPVYNNSHTIGSLFGISDNNNVNFKNIKINAMPDFGFDIRNNSGSMNFTNIRLEPSANSKVYLTSWRDGFHVKDNTAKLVWDNCHIGPLGDDAFNIASTTCTVDSFNTSARTINMNPDQGGVNVNLLSPGDELIIYNQNSGKLIGEAKVVSAFSSGSGFTVKIDRDLPLERGCKVGFYRYNKDFVVKNTYIEGTVRVRSSGTFDNCKFNVFWVNVENDQGIEGPIPKNITFNRCNFTTPYSGDANIFNVKTNTTSGAAGQYKCRNIVLSGCTFPKGNKPYVQPGNELIIR